MPTKTYHKLVRDRIPEIIEADKKICICETLSNEDYISLLDKVPDDPGRIRPVEFQFARKFHQRKFAFMIQRHQIHGMHTAQIIRFQSV